MSDVRKLKELPILPLRNTVLFPKLLVPLSVGREASLAAVESVLARDEGAEIFVVAQRDPAKDEVKQKDLYAIGTTAVVQKYVRREDGTIEAIVQGVDRAVLVKLDEGEKHELARVRPLPAPEDGGVEVEAMHRELFDLFARIVRLAKSDTPINPSELASQTEDPLLFAYVAASLLNVDAKKQQALLEAQTVADALRLLHIYLTYELQVLELRVKIADRAESEMGKEQREYMLRQQLRAIQQELGERSPEQADAEMMRTRLEEVDLPEHVRKEAERELNRLERIPFGSPEQNVIRTYLELILELPWTQASPDVLDLARARQVLNEDHYDLKEVKQRIIEHLGVLKLNPRAKAPILCFVGAPGVGKTSLGQSIARALKRKFERMSLGGMHDEAELRGHRRTYIGAMPGRIIQAIRRAGVQNPVLMLDEVDKLGRDFRGDPAFALLEILDPEQNKEFRDNYLDLPFDLSKVFFITTANSLDTIPGPLRDRMEILRLSGYTNEEKYEIARRYLIPRQLDQAGLEPEQCVLPEAVLHRVISHYTREAGVRQLERTIARLARKIALQFAEGRQETVSLEIDQLTELLGPEPFFEEEARQQLPAGVAPGLAWTQAGGEVLYVEAALLPDGKDLTLTGQLGDVMQESARAALSYVWANSQRWLPNPKILKESGVHIHVPAGAVPKDGPSAGVTMAAALASLLSGIPLRGDTAMTGEMTLTGLVMPVGGIKEKLLAAHRAGLRRIVLPSRNRKDLPDLPPEVVEEMDFVFVDTIEEVLSACFTDANREEKAAAGGGPGAG